MGGSAKESQLGASLAAEVEIRDTWLRFSSLDPQAKMDYLETQITASI
jgi:hypothetical protein